LAHATAQAMVTLLRYTGIVCVPLGWCVPAQGQCGPEEAGHVFAGIGGPDEEFGASVATDGLYAIVGAPHDDTPLGSDRGAVYVYIREGESWTFTDRLFASDGGEGDQFGISVAISGDTILIGADRYTDGFMFDAGAAYVFVQDANTWTQQARLVASDREQFDRFGFSASLSGDTAVLGAFHHDVDGVTSSGAAYVFVRQDGQWSEEAQLAPSKGYHGGDFGFSVAVWGDTAVGGAPDAGGAPDNGPGRAYVFARQNGLWTETAELASPNPKTDGAFGISVTVEGQTLAVAERYDSGSVHVFAGDGGQWPYVQTLRPYDPITAGDFGWSVSLEADLMAIGAPTTTGPDNFTPAFGALYLFLRDGGTWSQRAKMFASDAAAHDTLGVSVAMGRGALVAGAPRDDTPAGEDAGSAYFFALNCEAPCYGDFDGNGQLSLFDFLDFVNSFNAQDHDADCDQDGDFLLFDFLCFVNAFNAGC
jgi:hypothetical protein